MRADHVVDASVAVKLVLTEPDSHLARSWVTSAESGVLIAPDLLHVEVASAALKRLRLGLTDAQTAAEAVQSVAGFFDDVTPTFPLVDSALAIGLRTGTSVYDSIYLSLAQRLDVPLVTADERLVRRVQASGEQIKLLTLQQI